MTSEPQTLEVATTSEVRSVRRAIAERLARSGFSPPDVEDATIIASELVTNALLHAGPPVSVSVSVSRRDVSIEVSDGSDAWPVVQAPNPTTVGGNGMRIVETLSDEWGANPRPGFGKTVWFRLLRR